MELVPNESSAALLPDEEVVREGILDNRPRTMSAPLESEEFVTFEVKINGERAGRLKSVSIQDGGARFSHAPVIYPRSVRSSSNKLEVKYNKVELSVVSANTPDQTISQPNQSP